MSIPRRVAERYTPALDIATDAPAVLAWLLIYDWRITDAERRNLLAGIFAHYGHARPAVAARDAVANLATWSGWPFVEALSDEAVCGSDYCAARHPIISTACRCDMCVVCAKDNTCPDCEQCRECGSCDCVHCEQCGEFVPEEDYCAACAEGRNVYYCARHCTHETCAACERRANRNRRGHGRVDREQWCSDCEACNDHCECTRCSNCGDCCDSTCSDESYCDECCGCDSDDDDDSGEDFDGDDRTYPATHPRHRKINPSARMAGLEIEYNRCDTFSHIRNWARHNGAGVHEDGSCGWELVTAPAAGDALLAQITGACQAMSHAGASVQVSGPRGCGVHVHVDARDLLWPDIARLARVWARVEPAMYLLAGECRIDTAAHGAHSNYARPWGNAITANLNAAMATGGDGDVKMAILRAVYGSAQEHESQWRNSRGPGKHTPPRYRGLNLAPWIARWRHGKTTHDPKHGYKRAAKGGRVLAQDTTVEFRLHRGTLDATILRPWAMLLTRLVDYVASATDREVAALPRSAVRALLTIVGPSEKYASVRSYVLAAVKARRRAGRTTRVIGYHPRIGWTLDGAAQRAHAMDRAAHVQPELFTYQSIQVTINVRAEERDLSCAV